MEDCSVVVWWDITAAAMHTNAYLIVCLWSFVFVCLWACVLIVFLCLFVNVFVYLLVCWLGRWDWFREASVSYTHQWCVPARRVLALFLGRGGKKDGRGKNVNKENMGGGQKRENRVFTRKLSPVFVALCQLWILVSKMILACKIINVIVNGCLCEYVLSSPWKTISVLVTDSLIERVAF